MKYRLLTAVLVNAANEQQRLVERQQKQIDEQQRQIDALLHLVCGQNPSAGLCSESQPRDIAINVGEPVKSVSRRLGHKDSAMTLKVYGVGTCRC